MRAANGRRAGRQPGRRAAAGRGRRGRGANPRYPYKPPIPLTVIVNPVLEPSTTRRFAINEGCLSVPDLRGDVSRSVTVRVRYLDRDGAEHDVVRRGLTAGTFQHEVDHLDGVLFLDRVADPPTFTTWEQFERHDRARSRPARERSSRASGRDGAVVRAGLARRAGRARGRRAHRGRRRAHRRRARPAPRRATPSGCAGLTLPGLANAHSHAFQRALRGRDAGGRGSFWTWRDADVRAGRDASTPTRTCASRARRSPRWRWPGSRSSASSTTCTTAPAASVRRSERDGPRADRRGRRGGHPPHAARRLLPARRQPRASATRAPTPGPSAWRREAGPRGSAPRSTACAPSTRRARAVVAAWATARGAPLHAHVSEQPAENDGVPGRARRHADGAAGRRRRARRALHRRPRDARHATRDVALLGGAGATVCLCPTTERDLADGIGPARALADAGARLALGSDSHAVIDLFEEARAIELDERLATGERGRHTAAALLAAATRGGYASLGWPDGGRIEAGALADLTVVALGTSVRLAARRPRQRRLRRDRRRRARRDGRRSLASCATARTSRSTSPPSCARR